MRVDGAITVSEFIWKCPLLFDDQSQSDGVMIALDRIPAWIVIVIISREFIISGFRLIAADNGVVIAASYWGKFKTASQMVTVILLVLNIQNTVFTVLGTVFIYISLVLTVVSLIDYIAKNKEVLKDQN